MCQLTQHTRRPSPALLPKTIIIVQLIVTLVISTSGLTVNRVGRPDIDAKSKVELRPLVILCFLNDVIRVSAPMINEQAVYYLHSPKGDVMKLELGKFQLQAVPYEYEGTDIVSKFVKNVKPIVTQSNNFDVFSLKKVFFKRFDDKMKKMDPNDFMLGPLTEQDHGNWMLSVFTKDLNGDWIELYQVITITITEFAPITPWSPSLNIGDTFNLSFSYPINNLESCELVAPRSTFDRLFLRNGLALNNCRYSVPNITMSDKGLWKIIAVGRIVYEGDVRLHIKTPIKDNETSHYLFDLI